MAYRDPTAGHRLRVRALADEVARIEQSLRPAVWRLLPSELAQATAASRRRWEDARPQVERAELEADALQALLTLVETYRKQLEQVIELLPELRATHCTRPRQAPPMAPEVMSQREKREFEKTFGPLQKVWEGSRAAVLSTLAELGARVDSLPPRAPGSRDVVARFSLLGVPYVTRVQHDWQLATGIPTAAAPLAVRPELYRHSLLLKPLGLTRDLEFGEMLFDELFLVQADDEAEARALLDEGVRAGLLELAAWTVPSLKVADGAAHLHFGVAHEAQATKLLRRACELLAAIREASIHDELSSTVPLTDGPRLL